MVLVFAGPPRIELVVSTLPFVVASHTLAERHHSTDFCYLSVNISAFFLTQSTLGRI